MSYFGFEEDARLAQQARPQRWHHNYVQRPVNEHAHSLLTAFRPAQGESHKNSAVARPPPR